MNIPKISARGCRIATTIVIVSLATLTYPKLTNESQIALAAQNKPVVAFYEQKPPMPQLKPKASHYAPSAPAREAMATMTYNQNVWLQNLWGCESSGNPLAINPKDKDGTASYGLLEFKPATFFGFAKLYRITVTDFKDADEQVQITVGMVHHREEINWFQQFPDCVRKWGKPPVD